MKCIGKVLRKNVKSARIKVFSFLDENDRYGVADKERELTMQLRYNWTHDKLIENMDGLLVFEIFNGMLRDLNRLNLHELSPSFDCVIEKKHESYRALVPDLKDNICEKYNEHIEREKEENPKWTYRSKLNESHEENPIMRSYFLHGSDRDKFLEFCESTGAKYKDAS